MKSRTRDTFDQIYESIIKTMEKFPDTIETRSSFISICITFAVGLAREAPNEIRQHWAKELYKHADELAKDE